MQLQQLFKNIYNIPKEDFILLTSQFVTKAFSKGEYLIRPGQIQHNFYFVEKGIQMLYFSTGYKEHVINFTYPPYPCTIPQSFMLQKRSTCYIKCLSDSEFNYISYEVLQ